MLACPTRCPACSGRGRTLATLDQAVVEGPARDDDLASGTAGLLIATFLSFALEGLFPGYRYCFWLYGPQVLNGQWWQLVTSLFLHSTLLQLGFNTAALYAFGAPLENALGTRRFVALYLGAGMAGNLLSLVFHPRIQSVGASGCIFGIAGAWIGIQVRRPLFSGRVIMALMAYVAFALLSGFAADAALNNLAHLGGFVVGVAGGLAMAPSARAEEERFS